MNDHETPEQRFRAAGGTEERYRPKGAGGGRSGAYPREDDGSDGASASSEEQTHQSSNGRSRDHGEQSSDRVPDRELLVAVPVENEADIPQRAYVVPRYIQRSVLTLVAGPGGHGKSQLFVGWAVAVALGLALGDFKPPRPMRVAVMDVEDDIDEQRRRVAALLRRFGKSAADLQGRLLLLSPRRTGVLFTTDPMSGELRHTKLAAELVDLIGKFRPDVVMINPLGEVHDAEENDNNAMRHVAGELRVIAKQHNIGCLLAHHTRKGNPEHGNPDAGRGASSISGVVRKGFTLYQMTDEEAKAWNIKQAGFYFRLDGAKSNYDAKSGTAWFERTVLVLDNGDAVAVPWPWTPPVDAVGPEQIEALVMAVKAGDQGKPWSSRLGQYERSIGRAMSRIGIATKSGQRTALNSLFDRGIVEGKWKKPNSGWAVGLRHPDGDPPVTWRD